MERDSEAGGRKHGKVVGAVAHGYGLAHIQIFHLSYEAEQFLLAAPVDNLAEILSGELAVDNLQVVGIYIVESETLFKIVAEVSETT